MYASSLMFHTVPGKAGELENELRVLLKLVQDAGGENARILHTHFASPDTANVVFVQDAPDRIRPRWKSRFIELRQMPNFNMDQESSAIAAAIA
jgi:hypothetical protein